MTGQMSLAVILIYRPPKMNFFPLNFSLILVSYLLLPVVVIHLLYCMVILIYMKTLHNKTK